MGTHLLVKLGNTHWNFTEVNIFSDFKYQGTLSQSTNFCTVFTTYMLLLLLIN